jgi:AsmA protein
MLTLDDLALHLSNKPHSMTTLRGEATWRGGADVGASLAGNVSRTVGTPYDVVLNVTPANQRDPLYISLKLDGANDHTDLRVPPLAVAEWWAGISGGGSPTLPPLLGSVDATSLDVGPVHVKGLRVRATPNVPAAASSTPNAAAVTP